VFRETDPEVPMVIEGTSFGLISKRLGRFEAY
jgi:hypothetical protein